MIGEDDQAKRCDRAADLLQRFASPAYLVITPSREDAAAFGAAHIAPGIIERLPANMQLIEPAERSVLVVDPSPDNLCSLVPMQVFLVRREGRYVACYSMVDGRPRSLLLQQQHPQPVAVSERLPESGDCDELDNCWQWEPDINGHHPLGEWKLLHRDWLSDPDGDTTHWLPFNALPLPQSNDS